MILKRADIESVLTEFCFTKYLYNCLGRKTRHAKFGIIYAPHNCAKKQTVFARDGKPVPYGI